MTRRLIRLTRRQFTVVVLGTATAALLSEACGPSAQPAPASSGAAAPTAAPQAAAPTAPAQAAAAAPTAPAQDRKSTRLNSSHVKISYAVFCLKKKKNK